MSPVRPQVLVIDDEPQIHRFLSPALDAGGYEPRRADSGQEGLRAIALWGPDAVVLDLGLPDMDGKEVLRRAREFYTGPIIILSARDREAEKIAALDLGANDYVEKPFGVGLDKRGVTRAGERLKLRPKEYEVLAALARSPGKVITHKQLLTTIWGSVHAEDVQYLRVVVGQLRHKLEADPADPRLVITEPGVGYRLAP